MRKRTLALLPALALLASTMLHGQADSAAIGGPEDISPYGPAYADDAPGTDAVWSAEDSAHVIPGYELYGDFETETIFARMDRAKRDSTHLILSHAACDHSFPICGAINSPFGPRRGRMHYGIDIDLETGDGVMAAFEGMVRISKYHRQFGHVVVLRHPNGLETLYGHLSERLVEVGDHVEAGDLVGLGGSTGRSTGAHLHFETRYLGQPIDPQLLFDVRDGGLRADSLIVHPGLFSVITAQQKAKTIRYHRVRRGETLSAIARRNGTTVKALCRMNRIRSSSTLRAGQRLRLR